MQLQSSKGIDPVKWLVLIGIIILCIIWSTALSIAQTPDFIRTKKVGDQNVVDARPEAYLSLQIPRWPTFTLNGAKDSVGYIMYNTSTKRLGYYDGLSQWHSLSTNLYELSLKTVGRGADSLSKGLILRNPLALTGSHSSRSPFYFRRDAQLEIQSRPGFEEHALLSIAQTEDNRFRPVNYSPFGEGAVSYMARNKADSLVQLSATFSRWMNSHPDTGYAVWGVHVNYSGGYGSLNTDFLVYDVNHGATFFSPGYDWKPGYSTVGFKRIAVDRMSGKASIIGTKDLVLESAPTDTTSRVYINAYNNGNVDLVRGGGKVVIATKPPDVSGDFRILARDSVSGEIRVLANTSISQVSGTSDLSGSFVATGSEVSYLKTGRLIHADLHLVFLSNSDGAPAVVTGLPFNPVNTVSAAIGATDGLSEPVTCTINASGQLMFSKWNGVYADHQFFSGKTLKISVTYYISE